MTSVVTHAGVAGPPDPFGPEALVLGLGVVVFAVIAYDLYRNWSASGGEEWQ